ncbi:MAG: Outer membrane protein TolC [Verrucomicrobia bacterium]|nr:MAG: Outer membrane protein TolC [Verrucomicrobiota bacterium]
MFLRLSLIVSAGVCLAAAAPGEPSRVLTLDAAYDLALATDQTLAIAYAEARKGALEPASAMTRLMPTITGNASSNRSDRTGANRGFTSSLGNVSGGALTSNQTSLNLTWPFLDFTLLPAYRRGKLITESTRLEYQAAIRQTLFSVASAFFEVLSQQQIVRVSEETLRLAEENLAVARKRADAGAVTRADVLRAQASAEENRRALIQAQNDLTVKRNVLGNLLDFRDRTFRLTEPPLNRTPPPQDALDGLLVTAFTEREDLKARELVILQQKERRKEIRAQYAPVLSGQASASGTQASGNLNRSDWQAVLAVRFPFVDAGQRAIDLKRQGIEVEQSEEDYAKFRETVQEEVTNAFVAVRSLDETIDALEAQVDAESQAYQDVQTQYRAGTARAIDVLDALRTLNNARKDLAVQIYGYELALRRLDQVTGVLEEERVRKVAP